MKSGIVSLAAVALCAALQSAFAQYPNKPVRIVVPVTTGGPSDLVAERVYQVTDVGLAVVE